MMGQTPKFPRPDLSPSSGSMIADGDGGGLKNGGVWLVIDATDSRTAI
jgi:hypothetical protein